MPQGSDRPARGPQASPGSLVAKLKHPQILLPALVVVGMLALAFGLQPGSTKSARGSGEGSSIYTQAQPTATPPPATPTTAPTRAQAAAGTPAAGSPAAGTPASRATDEVAGARSMPSPTPETDFSRESTQCGSIQETAVALSVEQVLAGVSVRATRAAVYPADYFRCILMATGGKEAFALGASVSKAQREGGATHAVVIDLWITNAARDFGQVNLKTSQLAAAGQTFVPLATLGGRSEVVVSSGQGRTVSLVVMLQNSLETPGPMTLTIEAPLSGGKKTPGKYQLFLPTP